MRQLTKDDIMELGAYAAERRERRKQVMAIKEKRRVPLGPHAMAYFENFDTMWHQVHEMLYIEQGVNLGRPINETAVAEQLKDELAAYNPLIPNGSELVATIMFEIENPQRRDAFLDAIGNIEDHFELRIGDDVINGVAEGDLERTSESGRASSVQFIHFPFTDAQKDAFRKTDRQASLACTHANYAHVAVLGEEIKAELAEDFD